MAESCCLPASHEEDPSKSAMEADREHPSRPCLPLPIETLIFPCSLSHVRFTPKHHSFSYSYLMIGVPIWWQDGCAPPQTPFVSCESNGQEKPQWLHVRAEDYLMRGKCDGGLSGKLKQYLTQKVRARAMGRALRVSLKMLVASMLMILNAKGRRSIKVFVRLFGDSAASSPVFFQSRVFLVSLHFQQTPRCHDRRSQQYLW